MENATRGMDPADVVAINAQKARIRSGRIKAVDSDGHVRSCPSDLGGVAEGRGTRSSVRLAGSRRIRVGSWNETKWKGSIAREGNSYKLWYSGSNTARNGVGIILTERLKDNVVRVIRRSDRIMAIYVIIEVETVNVISTYAPQGDLNGHISAATDGYAGVHGGFGFRDRNEEGCTILEFATAHDLVVANSFFKKSDAYLITFQSGGHNTQIDYLLVRRGDLKACRDCRAFPDEACSSQHRLIIVDVRLERLRHKREAIGRPRILWKNLNGESVETFRATVSEKLAMEDMSASNADQMWNTLTRVGVANETARTYLTHVEAKERYKAAKREARIAVAKAKDKAYEDLYKKLDFKEGEDIRKRRGEYFSSLFNETPSEESRPEGSGEVGSSNPPMHYDYYYSRINQGEVRAALQKMGRNKAVGPDQIPIEAWSVPRELVWKTLLDKGTPRRYSRVIKDMYEGAKTRLRTTVRNTEFFPVEVDLHQGSAISPYLFTLILDELSRGIQENIPWCMIFADDIVLIAESGEGLNNRLESWRKALQDNGLRVSRDKTEYLRCDFGRFEVVHQEVDIRIGDQILQLKESFRYLGSVLHRSGRIDDDVAHRIRAGWMKWREASGFLCDRRIPLKLKGNFYRAVIRPTMLYGSKCWPIMKALSNKVEVAELRMLRWTCDEGRRLRWFGHVKRRPQTAPVRRVEALVVEGSSRRGRPKLRWEDRLKMDMKELRLSEDMTSDRNAWRDRIRTSG
nr:ataxia telangiectasia mutated family protein [Tanacetum cinerariifolium]